MFRLLTFNVISDMDGLKSIIVLAILYYSVLFSFILFFDTWVFLLLLLHFSPLFAYLFIPLFEIILVTALGFIICVSN